MNIRKLLISAVLPVLFISTAFAQQTDEGSNKPKKGDVTLAATVGYNSYTSITAQPGNLYNYEAAALSTDWTN